MKIIFRIFIALSVVCVVVISLKLLDTYTSLKYEIDEPKAMQKVSEALLAREKFLQSLASWLWVSLTYVLVAIAISIRALSEQ